MFADFFAVASLVLCASFIAFALVLGLGLILQNRPKAVASLFTTGQTGEVFIFDGDGLIDTTPAARAILGPLDGQSDWAHMLHKFGPIFPGLATRLEGLSREGRFVLCSREDLSPALVLRAEHSNGLVRLTLISTSSEDSAQGAEAMVEIALREEVAQLRDILARAPIPIWRETSDGDVIWANGPYMQAASQCLDQSQEFSWPLPRLFPAQILPNTRADTCDKDANLPLAEPAPKAFNQRHDILTQPQSTRHAIGTPDNQKWYDIQSHIAVSGHAKFGHICYGLPADDLVRAEKTLQDFTQTLAKTFAQLPIGLAIFDKSRVLQMFNPALLDLSGLPVDFLISRPTLPTLLDAMREQSRLPEPKDYRSWRRQMAEMEKAAAEGLFEDTWALPSGQTWRVTGRPYPNGALAFMIEDISTEMSRARRYRADLELGQAVIDGLHDAVVVFAQDGSIAFSNTAASELWGETSIRLTSGSQDRNAINRWRKKTAPSLLWGDLEHFIGLFGPREAWEGELQLNDGRGLICRALPLPHGSTLTIFQLIPTVRGVDPPLNESRARTHGHKMIA